MKNLKPWMATAGIMIATTASLAFFKVSEIQASIAEAEARPEFSQTVESHTVDFIQHAQTITVLGKAVAPQHLSITNESAGKITAVNFESGQLVKKGDVLVQQDISEERARLQSATARAKLAKAKFKRVNELRHSNAVNQNDLDQAQSELDIALADIALLKAQISKKTIRATFTGRTGIHQLRVGQYLMPNAAITDLVAEQDFIWLDFNLPQVYSELTIGSEIKVRKVSQGDETLLATAEIIAKSPDVAENTRSTKYRARLKLADMPVSPRSVVELEVPVASAQQVLNVPNAAIQHSSQGNFVYLLTPNEEGNAQAGFRSKKAFVQVQEKTNHYSLISQGLEQGDLIAAIGTFKLYDGALVFVANPTKAGALVGE